MTSRSDTPVQAALLETETFLQDRLAAVGLDVPYILIAVAPDGEVCLVASMETPELKDMVDEIKSAVNEAMDQPSDSERFN